MSQAAPERSISSASFEAFGGLAIVAVAEGSRLAAARQAVETVIDAFDRACSRFREDSELAKVNRAPGQWAEVSPLFLEAMRAALRAAELTDGDVDPTVGQALIALGYDRDFAELETGPRRQFVSVASVPGWRAVQVDPAIPAVRIGRGVRLDLGATAKALAADYAVSAAAAAAGCGALVSLSGDLAIAGPPPHGGWRVRVTDDHRAEVSAPGQWISLRSGGLATSSTTVRRWSVGSGQVHHLVDPTTGGPSESPWRTVSVAAGSCLDANIASTAAVIRGQAAPAWLDSLGLPSRLVSEQGTVCHLGGWPDEGDDLPAERRASLEGQPA